MENEIKTIHNMLNGKEMAKWQGDDCPSAWEAWSYYGFAFPCCIINADGTLFSRM